MYHKLKFDNPFRIQFTIQKIAFRLCTKQSARRKSLEDKQLKFAPQSDKFAFESVNLLLLQRNKPQLILNRSSLQMFILGHWK